MSVPIPEQKNIEKVTKHPHDIFLECQEKDPLCKHMWDKYVYPDNANYNIKILYNMILKEAILLLWKNSDKTNDDLKQLLLKKLKIYNNQIGGSNIDYNRIIKRIITPGYKRRYGMSSENIYFKIKYDYLKLTN